MVPAAVDPELVERCTEALPPDKAARVASMRSVEARAATLLGISLLRDCAAAAGLEPPLPASLSFPQGDKPVWPAGPDFSISHSAGYVACALAPPGVQVGVDIEPAEAAARAGLRHFTSAEEREAFLAAGLTVTDLWTAKEAVAKLTGLGLAAVREIAVTTAGTARCRGAWFVLDRPRLAAGMHCTLAMSESVPVTIREVPAAGLFR